MDKQKTGELIKSARIKKGYTQVELAEKANVTKSVISYYENRDRSPSPDVVKRFSEIFNVSTDYLLGANNREIPDMIDVSGLSEKEVAALKLIIDSMKGRK